MAAERTCQKTVRVVGAETPALRVSWRGVDKTVAPPCPNASAPVDDASAAMALLESRLAQTEAAAEQRIRESYGAGLAEGQAAGKAEVEAQVNGVLERLALTLSELAEVRRRIMAEAQPDLVKLSIEVARRILHRELATDANAIRELVKAAIEKLEGQTIYKV